MKIVCFSDTHTKHGNVILPECDLAIFAGDCSRRGYKDEIESFLSWYNKQIQCKNRIWIAGNHECSFESKFNWETGADMWLEGLKAKYPNLIYLENNYCIIEGFKIWGSPITPDFFPEYWAFNMSRGEQINKVWEAIPEDTDIIVTHGPVYGILDKTPKGDHVGCEDLRKRVEKIQPLLHISGHIHCARGEQRYLDTIYVNASICDEKYTPVNEPIIINL